MVALLVGLSVMAVLLTVAMPAYKQMSRREKEEELVFRGQQYARALRLFGMKYANAAPPNINVLIEQRFLRKKYKDPITNDDFQPVLAGGAIPGTTSPAQIGSAGQRGGAATPGAATSRGTTPGTTAGVGSPGAGTAGRGSGPLGGTTGPVGGVIGVTSKSKDLSIRLYNGRNHYNEWAFVYTPQVQAPGAVPGVGVPGQRGGPGTGQNPFGGGITGPGGGRGGRGGQTPQPPNRGGGGAGTPPGRGNPGTSPFGPSSPFQPAQPIQPGRGRGL